jgi:TP901-1 family phage major tail protein
MSAQQGRLMLLKIGDGGDPETFTSVAGLQSNKITINNATVDTTNADSPGGWRELLEGAGIKSASVSGSGVFKDAAADETVRAAHFAGTIKDWQIIIPNFGTIAGPFQISQLEYAGQHNGEMTYSLSLESAGQLSWTAA